MNTKSYDQKNSVNDEGADLKEIFVTLKRYYKSLLFVTLMTVLFTYSYLYFIADVYQSVALIKLPEDKKTTNQDFMAIALGEEGSNLEDETSILKTRYLALKALENLNIGTRYYTKKNLKSYELYKDSPFIVTFEYLSPKAMQVPIILIPSDKENHFRLIIEPTLIEKAINTVRSFITPLTPDEQPIVYNELHSFGKKIETPWFTITVQKAHEFTNNEYFFTMLPNELMTYFIGKHLSVSPYTEKGNIIALSFEDNVPLRAKEIIEALTNAYISENLINESKSADSKLHFIDMQLKAIEKTLEGSSESLVNYKSTNKLVDLSEKAQMTTGKLSDFETQLYDINMRIDVLENTLNYIESHQDMRGLNILSTKSNNQSNIITNIISDIQKAIAMESDLLSEYKEAHPKVIKIKRQLLSLRSSLKEAILSSLYELNKRKQSINDAIEENNMKIQMLPVQEKKLARLTRNFKANEKIYAFLLEKRAETAVIESSTVSEIRIVDFPVVEILPIKPKRMAIIVVGFLLGIIFGMIQALLRAKLDNTVKIIEDIEKLTAIPIYGSLPFFHSNKNLQPYHESLRVIRTNLEFLQKTGKSKLITVTSSVPREGKSTIVIELGKIIGQGNKKVIILDLDMRRSTMNTKLDISNTIGMSTLLTGKNSLEQVVQKTSYENLSCITSGPIPPNPSELIMSDRFEEVIKELMSKYDYVLIDSAPIGMVTDAMKIMHMSTLNLIVLRAKISKKEFIKNINRLVDKHDLNAGIVLNSVEFNEKAGYGYGYGYSYGTKGSDNYYGVN